MSEEQGVTIGVLAERIKAVQEDVSELRQQRREDHHRLRSVEAAVTQMIDAQKSARDSESRQYRRLGNRYALGQLVMAAAVFALAVVTLAFHAH